MGLNMKQVKFKGKWRPYQERVLNELKHHFHDKKLHVVAPPGSGKTILGLEVLMRFNKPTLILAPTITIREQWISRFESFFLPSDFKKEDYITNDLKQPKFITVSTYQALHAAYNKILNEESIDDEHKESIDFSNMDLIKELRKINLGTIVIDEAHHLRNEWWKSLTEVIDQFKDLNLVSLTATPPYDVSRGEWDKYQSLCGEIDAEIYVPELVSEHNLCPHQDFIYINYPTLKETESLIAFKQNVNSFVSDLRKNDEFIQMVINHPWIKNPEEHMEQIYSNIHFYTSMLSFLKNVNVNLSKKAIKVLGNHKRVPRLKLEWLETLLSNFIYHEDEELYKNLKKTLKKELKKIGCIERRKVTLKSNAAINKNLVNSLGKLNSIKEIVLSETESLNESLRMVILTDFIHKEVINNPNSIQSIGVLPIFEILRREKVHAKLGVLTGSIVMIPKTSLSLLKKLLEEFNMSEQMIKIKEYINDASYCEVEFVQNSNKQKVNVISKLFALGGIEVLIGTKSLLGEGWDEPTINSLILASYVGSYMLSNQMRGRAIRVDANNPKKTANIWHLVCIDREDLYEENINKKIDAYLDQALIYGSKVIHSEDYDTLRRRFDSFVGLSYDGSVIENGIERINIIKPPFTKANIESINKQMLTLSKDRKRMREDWFHLISNMSSYDQVTEEVRTNKEVIPRPYIYFDRIAFLILEILLILRAFILPLFNITFDKTMTSILMILSIMLLIPAVKTAFLLLRYGSISGRIDAIGQIILETLQYLDLIQTAGVRVKTEKKNKLIVSCALYGANTYEKTIFNEALKQFLDVIDNPRYLLVRYSVLKFIVRRDYHAIPDMIGKNKTGAEMFKKRFRKYIGRCDLIYTRTLEGRKQLLKARVDSLSYQSLELIEKKRVWKNKWR